MPALNPQLCSSLNALVVDDSVAILKLMAQLLKQQGIKAKVLASGLQALELVQATPQRFQVIFVDLNMPNMDGIQLIRELSAVNYNGPIVIISELDKKIINLAEETSKKQQSRLIGCIPKPITEEKLFPILKKLESTTARENYKFGLTAKEIKLAIQQMWFRPYYQPMVNNVTGKVYALEVLARMIRPGEKDAIAASQFIATAERLGLVEQISFDIIEASLNDYPMLAKEFGEEVKLSINISPLLLHNRNFPEQIYHLINSYGIPCERVVLELTENQALDKVQQLETLNRLRIKGFHLGLDDYGTGFTNIQQLKSLPYTEVKIDRSLVYGICRDKLSQVVAKSLLDVFQELNVEIVAEGVEMPEDLDYINKLKLPINIQGYIISKPKSLDNILRWHRSWKKQFTAQTA